MLSEDDVGRLAAACLHLPEPEGNYLEDDFLVNLVATVVDFQTHTTAVVRAIEHFREEVLPELHDVGDLVELMNRYPADRDGNTDLAQRLWGYRMWTRAQLLRDLVAHFVSIGVTDQHELRAWAATSTFADFQGKVPGLGRAVYQWLVMRVGVDTVKPDVHVLRFVGSVLGRPVGDTEAVEAVSAAARRLGRPVLQLDWAIWEAGRLASQPVRRPPPAGSRLPRRARAAEDAPGARSGTPGPTTSAGPDGPVASFVDDEPGYLAWLAAHPYGFVLNSERRPRSTYLVLHRAGCGTISGAPARGKTFTSPFRKTCAPAAASLTAWALAAAGPPSPCGLCKP